MHVHAIHLPPFSSLCLRSLLSVCLLTANGVLCFRMRTLPWSADSAMKSLTAQRVLSTSTSSMRYSRHLRFSTWHFATTCGHCGLTQGSGRLYYRAQCRTRPRRQSARPPSSNSGCPGSVLYTSALFDMPCHRLGCDHVLLQVVLCITCPPNPPKAFSCVGQLCYVVKGTLCDLTQLCTVALHGRDCDTEHIIPLTCNAGMQAPSAL